MILGGGFAILLDADHLLQFLDLEMISRMSHGIPFAVLVAIILYFVFNRRDLRLAVVGFSAVISHIAFDVFLASMIKPNGGSEFPLFAPLLLDKIYLQGNDWLILEMIGFGLRIKDGIDLKNIPDMHRDAVRQSIQDNESKWGAYFITEKDRLKLTTEGFSYTDAIAVDLMIE